MLNINFICSFVDNLICSLLPPEVQSKAEPNMKEGKIAKETDRKSKSSPRFSVKGQKKKPKLKKK